MVESFDFTVCMAAVWFDHATQKWQSLTSDRFYSDLSSRRLFYTSPVRNEDAGGSLMRVRKFLAKGYNIQAPSLAAVVWRLMQGVHMDSGAFKDSPVAVLTGLLREVDPLTIVDGCDLVDEHEIVTEQKEA